MIQSILFATDMGPHTHYLLNHVNALAEMHNAQVMVLHAMEPPGQLAEAVGHYLSTEAEASDQGIEGISDIADGIKSRLIDMLEDEFIDGQQGLSQISGVKVILGKPADIILEEITASHADMVILGSHSQSIANPNMLGSVTSKVLQMSRVPVYMVPLVKNLMPQSTPQAL